jgi:hypothetical protein
MPRLFLSRNIEGGNAPGRCSSGRRMWGAPLSCWRHTSARVASCSGARASGRIASGISCPAAALPRIFSFCLGLRAHGRCLRLRSQEHGDRWRAGPPHRWASQQRGLTCTHPTPFHPTPFQPAPPRGGGWWRLAGGGGDCLWCCDDYGGWWLCVVVCGRVWSCVVVCFACQV